MGEYTPAVLLTSHSVICSVRGRKAGTRPLTGQYYVSMNTGSHGRLINRPFLILVMELFGIIFTIRHIVHVSVQQGNSQGCFQALGSQWDLNLSHRSLASLHNSFCSYYFEHGCVTDGCAFLLLSSGAHLINTNCSAAHNRQALSCKMALEYDTFIKTGKK